MAQRYSMARPSSQCPTPPSNLAGPLRTSVPSSQAGSAPSTGTSSMTTSSSSVCQPLAMVVSVAAVSMVRIPSRRDGARYTVHFGPLSTVTRLTPVSYVVLGLVRELGAATPYALKQAVALSIGNFWSIQHAQLYSEPERLAKAGLLDEEVETTGRRRKTYRLTKPGEEALDAWLAEPATEFTELRHRGLLKLALGADPKTIAPAQLELHETKLAEYESFVDVPMPEGLRIALDSGIGHEREWVRFWRELAER